MAKYPPSLAYRLLTLVADALLLFATARFLATDSRIGDTFQVFGCAQLFFYVAHLYVYALIGLAIPGHTPSLGSVPTRRSESAEP